MTDDPSPDKAYDLKTPADSVALYRAWAETYDSGFVADHGYELHLRVAEAFGAAGGKGPVLDVGAGTGLCGAALHTAGVGPVDATDISAEMLEQAAAKSVYRTLFVGDILAGLDAAEATYAGVVSSGTFTHGHVGPEALTEVLRLMAPGGIAVLSINDAHYETAGFAAAFEALAPQLAHMSATLVPIYSANAQGDHARDVARIVTFAKA